MKKAMMMKESDARIRKVAAGVTPKWKDGAEYKGIPLTADVRERMAEYRAYPSVQEQTQWIVGGV